MALAAIFFDAAVGHGLLWENDPYWTYWVTKTFLIATIFGLGTAWFGIGLVQGAAITAVHTLVLTVYYWSLSPVGLPSQPEWLDVEHTWITGVPVHFAVIYLGYLAALWAWRRSVRVAVEESRDSAALRTARGSAVLAAAALLGGVALTILAGLATALALGEFPGLTWFVVRLLIAVVFLLAWWAFLGIDLATSVVGGVMLALVWATYSHFLAPIGLPDTPLRILDTAPPPATVRWLDYTELWLTSLPIFMVVMVAVLALAAWSLTRRTSGRGSLLAAAALPVILLLTAQTAPDKEHGQPVELSTSGSALVETGAFYSNVFNEATGDITIRARDIGSRVTPLPPHDALLVNATVEADGQTFELTVDQAMVEDPLGRHTTWWGVGLHVVHHGNSGIGTSRLPPIASELAAFGLGRIEVDGRLLATGVPVHVMTADSGLTEGSRLELSAGDPDAEEVPGLPGGHLRVLWPDYEGSVSQAPRQARYLGGSLVLLVMLAGGFFLARRELGVRSASQRGPGS